MQFYSLSHTFKQSELINKYCVYTDNLVIFLSARQFQLSLLFNLSKEFKMFDWLFDCQANQ